MKAHREQQQHHGDSVAANINSQLIASPPEVKAIPQKEAQVEGQTQEELSVMDSDLGWARIFNEVNDAKRLRRELQEQKREIDRERRALEAREARLIEVENSYRDIFSLIRQLKDLGIDASQATTWFEAIHEYADMNNLDLKAASCKLTQDLRFYQSIGGIEKELIRAQQHLTTLNKNIEQKQQAVMTLVMLENRGIGVDEILGLSKLLDLAKLARDLDRQQQQRQQQGEWGWESNNNGGGNGQYANYPASMFS